MSEKIMPLEILSSIKGATSSEAVEKLFRVIKDAIPESRGDLKPDEYSPQAVSLEDLRSDRVEGASEIEKELIKNNFPKGNNGLLVVPKVIED